MKALAIFPSDRTIRIVERHPEPEMTSPKHVTVRMLEVGLCGTDKEIAAFEYGIPPMGSDYLVLGHEGLGEVADVGQNVSSIEPGDLVVPMVRRPCPDRACLACRGGRPDFCYSDDYTERGIKLQHGLITEMVVDEEDCFVRVPAELRDVAVLLEPLTIVEKTLIQLWQVQERLPWECREARESGRAPKLRALVLGAGPVGLLGAMAIRRAGFDTVVYSRGQATDAKARVAEAIGARYVSAKDVAAKELPEAIGRVDFVFEAVGASRVAFEVLTTLSNNAVFAFTGVPGRKEPVEVDTDTIMKRFVLKNQLLFGTVNAGKNAFDAAVQDLAAFRDAWPAALDALITGRYPITEAPALLQGAGGGIKNVITIE